jgi:serine/threonine protein kinase
MKGIKNIKIVKQKGNAVICFSFVDIENNKPYFGKLIHTDLQTEFIRERDINRYLNNNITDFKYFTKMLKVYENITLPDNLRTAVDTTDADAKYNLMIFAHSGNRPLRYYINRMSRDNFKDVLRQLREATALLSKIGVIHYDLYCESNVMLKKEHNRWVIKIIDFGLSYVDLTDDSDSDYQNILESIECFNNRHIIQ